jgi:hypothetical protein
MVTARPMRPFLNGFFSKYSKAKFGAPSGDPEQVSLADLTFAIPCPQRQPLWPELWWPPQSAFLRPELRWPPQPSLLWPPQPWLR